MKAGILFSKLLEKAGIDVTDEAFKDLLAVQIEVPEEHATKLDTELLSKESGKKILKKDIIDEFTKGVYINIENDLKEFGMSKEQIDEAFVDKSLGKVVRAAIKKTAEFKESASTEKSDDKKLRDDIKALNQQLADYKENFVPKTEVSKVNELWEADKYNSAIEKASLGKKWSDNFTEDVRADLFKVKLDKKLAELGAKAIVSGKSVKIVKSDDIQSDYFDNSNKLVTFESLVDEVMTTNKFLAVSTETQSAQTTVTATNGGGTKFPKSNPTLSLLNKSLEDQGVV